jgi:hypothetical protein
MESFVWRLTRFTPGRTCSFYELALPTLQMTILRAALHVLSLWPLDWLFVLSHRISMDTPTTLDDTMREWPYAGVACCALCGCGLRGHFTTATVLSLWPLDWLCVLSLWPLDWLCVLSHHISMDTPTEVALATGLAVVALAVVLGWGLTSSLFSYLREVLLMLGVYFAFIAA